MIFAFQYKDSMKINKIKNPHKEIYTKFEDP